MTNYPWLKLWNEFVEDDKFPAAADMVGSTPAIAEATFLRLMAYANQQPDRGSIAGFHPQRIASRLRVSVDEIRRLIEAFRELGMLVGARLANWVKRQTGRLPKPRSAGAERTARYRQRRADKTRQGTLDLESSASPTVDVTSAFRASQTGVTSVVEEEEERLIIDQPLPPIGVPQPEIVVQFDEFRRSGNHDAQKRKRRLSSDWRPDEDDRAFALNQGYDEWWVDEQSAIFLDHHTAKGSVFASVSAAWRNWVRNAPSFARSAVQARSGGGRREPPSIFDALDQAGLLDAAMSYGRA